MATILMNDLEVYYELHGNGQPLVLIAGYTCDHTVWHFMLPELAKHFQVLIFDNRAVGQTKDTGEAFTLETLAQDTINLIRKLELQRPHILGQSMGGAVAQIIAAQYPEAVDHLILLNTVAKFGPRSSAAMVGFLKMRQADISLDLQLAAGLPWFFSDTFFENPENINAYKQLLLNNPFPQTLADQVRQFRAVGRFNSLPWLHQIKSRTLIIISEEDICALPKESEQLTAIAKNEIKKIPGGHASPTEQFETVNAAIIKFLLSP